MLMKHQIPMIAKAFSVGLRIEHLQSVIDRGLYGKFAGSSSVGKGEYQLSYRERERGVYTFCMCPGGVVVPSASEWDTVVTNGMSEYREGWPERQCGISRFGGWFRFWRQPNGWGIFSAAFGTDSFFGRRRRIHCTGANSKKFFRSNAAGSTKIIRTDLFLWSSPISAEKSVS